MTFYRPKPRLEPEPARRTARPDSDVDPRLHARGSAHEPSSAPAEPRPGSIHARGGAQSSFETREETPYKETPRPAPPEETSRQDLREAPAADYAEFGCEVNTLAPDRLLDHYARSRLLYSEKAARLEPFLPLVLENWERAAAAGSSLLRVVLRRTPDDGLASMATWRCTWTCWHAQHLVGSGPPEAVRAVILASQKTTMREGRFGAVQMWFRPDHPYMGRVFGTLEEWMPPGTGSVESGDYLMVPLPVARSLADPEDHDASTSEWDGDGACAELAALAVRTRGALYARAEELWTDDLLLTALDSLYRTVGLRRRRRIWLHPDERGRLSGAALAHEGPLGLNLSLLENRLDLLVDPGLDAARAERVVRRLLPRACEAYESFPLGAIPVATDARTGRFLREAGAEPVARYSRAIWLAEGYADFYRHIDELYGRRGDGAAPDRRAGP
ncbi:hypothetical protein ACYSUO_16010 [Streptomyces sp. UC4497]